MKENRDKESDHINDIGDYQEKLFFQLNSIKEKKIINEIKTFKIVLCFSIFLGIILFLIDGFFLISVCLFFCYFLTFWIFGFFIFYILSNNYSIEKISLSYILIFFAIGVSIHVLYMTIIVSLKIFNFYTIYLPFIIIDVLFLEYYVKRKKNNNKLNRCRQFVYYKEKFLNYIKNNIWNLLILLIILIMAYILQMYFIWNNLGFPGNDPYFYFKNIWFIHKNNYLDLQSIGTFPPGFMLFCAGVISFINNYYIIFFFLKFLPLILYMLNLIILFEVSKSIFKHKINIFFTLAIYLGFSYASYRYTMPLPSILATTLGLIFIILFKEKSIAFTEGKGIVIAGMILTHPLYGLYFLLFFISYYILFFFIDLWKKNFKFNRKTYIFNFFANLIYINLIVFIMVLPFFILTSIALGFPITEFYYNFIKPELFIIYLFNDFVKIGEFFANLAIIIMNAAIFNNLNIFKIPYFGSIELIYLNTIGIGIFIIFIGIIFPYKKLSNINSGLKKVHKNNRIYQKSFYYNYKENLIGFLKYTFIITVIIFIILFIVNNYIYIPFLYRLINFLNIYSKRLFELFAGYWALLFVVSFNCITIFIRILIRKLNIYIKYFKKYSFKNIYFLKKGFTVSIYSFIILISSFFYITNFTRPPIYQYYDSSQVEVILFAGNYFNENPLNDNSVLLKEKAYNEPYWYIYEPKHSNYELIYNPKLMTYFFNFSYLLSYSQFKTNINVYSYYSEKYVIFNINNFSEDFIHNFTGDFTIIYKNAYNWTFAQLKN